MSRVASKRATEADRAARREHAIGCLATHGLELGQVIKVDGEGSATFVIVDAGRDGSVTCNAVGGGTFRSFRPEWCYPATRVNRRGRTVATTVPREIKGRRDAWRRTHGFAASNPGEGARAAS